MEMRQPLTRQQVRDVIEFRGCDQIPLMYHFWIWQRGDATPEWNEKVKTILSQYPSDVACVGFWIPDMWNAPADAPRQRWAFRDKPAEAAEGHGLDSGSKIINDLDADIDAFIADMPDPNYEPLYGNFVKTLGEENSGRYRLCISWAMFFERLWSLMGMEEALLNFYTCPESMHKLIRALCEYHKATIRKAASYGQLDGFFISDDIGQQTGTFFSVDVFNEFYKPYFKEIIDECHKHNMHMWLHTCGNIEAFMPGFVEIGLDVIHPIQKYTMEESDIVEKWGGKICFWAGFDVQRILPYGTPDDVRREVRFMIDTYGRKDGGLMLTAGNGVTPDNPPENIAALFDESVSYGSDYRKRMSSK